MDDSEAVARSRFIVPLSKGLRATASLYDGIESLFEDARTQRSFAVFLVFIFAFSLVLIESNRQGLLPEELRGRISTNHFGAVALAFTLLLIFEVLSLVFALARSVADSMGKQFELLSLVLLRKAFFEVSHFGEPVDWKTAAPAVPVVIADMAGALLIFAATSFYYRLQRHRRITSDEADQAGFVAAKKAVALLLLGAFILLGAREMLLIWLSAPDRGAQRFFEIFYTVLIFSDVLLVLIALCYSTRYPVVFRNSGFAAATVMMRLALTAPPYINVLLGLGAVLFSIALTLAYNSYMAKLAERQ